MATFDIGIVISAFNRSKPAFANVNKDLKKTERNAQRTSKSLRAIQVVLASIAIGAGAQFAKTIVKTVGDMELLIARLSQVQGGLGAARNTLNKLIKDFAGTPFSIDAVANSFTRLRAAGLGTDQAFKTLSAGADAVAAFGGSTQELNRFIIGLQQSIGKGTLSMEELRQQIGEAVPSAMRVLAREMGISMGQLFSEIEAGSVDSIEAVRLLTEGLEKDFGGFAEKIGDKILGSLNKAKGLIRVSLFELFTIDTNAAQQTVDFINTVSAGIQDFIDGVTQSDVDGFFTALNNAASSVGLVVRALSTIGKDLVRIANPVFAIVGPAGAVAGSLGLIGFLLWGGPPGAIIAAIAGVALSTQKFFDNVGLKNQKSSVFREFFSGGGTTEEVSKKLKERIKKLQAEQEGLFNTIGNIFSGRGQEIARELAAAGDALAGLSDPTTEWFQSLQTGALEGKEAMEEFLNFVSRTVAQTSIKLRRAVDQAETTTVTFGSQTAEKFRRKLIPLEKSVEEFSKKLEAFQSSIRTGPLTEQQAKDLSGAIKEYKSQVADLAKANAAIGAAEAKGIAAFADKVAVKFTKAKIAVSKFGRQLQGEDAKIIAVRDSFDSVRLKIEAVIKSQKLLGDTEGLAKSKALMDELNVSLGERLAKTHEELDLKTQIFALEQQSARLQIDASITQLQREGRSGLQQSFSSSFSDQAQDKRLQLNQDILQTGLRIKALEAKRVKDNDVLNDQITATQNKLREFSSAQQTALNETTAAGLLAKSVWKDVGDTIQESVKGALFDLTKGTFDAEKALLSFYDSITKAAINYLVELVKIQFAQNLAGATAGGTGGGAGGGGIFGLLGQFFANANGAAVRGGITPFANGGIVRGPTMFGLAGEAGEEAILPLQRVGGQLGVRADVGGGGGDQFHVTVNAIDGPSAAAFFQKNSHLVVNAVRQENRLNNGPGAVR